MTIEEAFQNDSVKVPAIIFVLFLLEFYGPSTHCMSFRAQSVNLMMFNNVLVVHDYLA